MAQTKLVEKAVKVLLAKPEIAEDMDFINLMDALWLTLEPVSDDIGFGQNEVREVQNAVGEFVPNNWVSP